MGLNAPGFWEWLFLGAVALLIFGPERLPKMAQSAGEMIAKFKREAAGTLDELKAAAELEQFTEVARDLRDTTDDLRRSVDLTGVTAGATAATKPQTAVMAPVAPGEAPPFDPDTP